MAAQVTTVDIFLTCAAVKILCLEHGTEQVAIGTVYKDMKLKPTVLKEYTEDVTMAQQLAADSFCDDDDGLVLEDETARIKLTGALDISCMVTGIVLAAKGVLDEKTGIFDVSEICFAGMLPAYLSRSRSAWTGCAHAALTRPVMA